MKFRAASTLEYTAAGPATLMFCIRVRASPSRRLLREKLEVAPPLPGEWIVTKEDNGFDRFQVAQAGTLKLAYSVEVEAEMRTLDPGMLRKTPPARLDSRVVPYLFPSRYCQSDLLSRLAWKKFGAIQGAYSQVTAINSWIHENIEYVPGVTRSATSAFDTVTERAGVCRDFAHLGIALCRALNIPARYISAYAVQLQPPDFHACYEAFIGEHWVVFDPTRLAPVNGLLKIGAGQDAADISVCTIFGMARGARQQVECVSLDPAFQPLSLDNPEVAVCLDPGSSP